jgi:hypothetical protein
MQTAEGWAVNRGYAAFLPVFERPHFRRRAPPPGGGRCPRYLLGSAPRGCTHPSTNLFGPLKAALEKNDSVFLHIALEAGGGARARASNQQNGRKDQRS